MEVCKLCTHLFELSKDPNCKYHSGLSRKLNKENWKFVQNTAINWNSLAMEVIPHYLEKSWKNQTEITKNGKQKSSRKDSLGFTHFFFPALAASPALVCTHKTVANQNLVQYENH